MKILLIDDQSALLEDEFEDFNETMFFAENEKQARSILSDETIDAILMDGSLGSDVTGADIVKSFRASGIMTKIIMFSSDNQFNIDGINVGAIGTWGKENLEKDGWGEDLLEYLKQFGLR